MRSGRPKTYRVILTDEQREQLEAFGRSRSLPHGLARRARIVLLAAQGLPSSSIAAQLGVSDPTVAQWCKRFIADGIDGLYDLPSGGRPRTYGDDEVAGLMQCALDERPADGTHWSVRSFAEASGVSKSTVHRYFNLFGVQPHRTRTFKLSTDAFFVEKVRDIVGLYLNQPDHALVLCVDEKSQVERWFGIITQRAIKRSSFKSVSELTARINRFVEQYNENPVAFMWTATADSIFEKLTRLSKLLCGTAH